MKRIYELAQAKNQFEANAGISFHYFHAGITPHEKHFHDFYEVLIVIKGQMTHHINEKTIIMKKGDMMFLRPHDHHYFEKLDNCDCIAINIPFSDVTFLEILSFIHLIEYSSLLFETVDPPQVSLSSRVVDNAILEFQTLEDVQKQNLKIYISKLKCTLSNMLTYFFTGIDEFVHLPEWFTYLCQEMHKRENFQIGISRMLELTDKTYQHIGRTFKKYLNMTPTHFVNHLRIRYGVNLIINTNLPTTEVVYECGFNNSSQFFKLFKEFYNTTPKELKNDIIKFL
jgi:AraC family cel operon transcriptional repressor